MIQDLRYAVRVLFKSKALTAVALLTLALGIGVNSAIFSVVNAIVLRPLPYPNSQRLMVIWGNLHKPGLEEIEISALELRDFQQQCKAFEHIGAYSTEGLNLTGGDQPERLRGAAISANLFSALGVRPHAGRNIAAEEDRYGNDRVAVVSHSLWQRRFGGDPGIINSTIQLDGRSVSVVGVMPADFHFPDRETEIWIPLAFTPDLLEEDNRGSHFLNVIARLKPGVTTAQAQADLNTVTSRLATEHASTYRGGFSTTVRSLHEELVGDLRRAMLVLLGAVGLVLLIACANVAHLRLASATSRYREFAIRAALGAGRGRVVRQFLTESVLLSLIGGAVGLALAVWVVRVLVLLMPKDTPRLEEIKLDYRVVLFTLGTSLLTGIVFGLAPAFQAARTNLNDVLKEAGRSGGDTSRRLRLRNLLVVSEFALSLVLLIGAGLMVKSLLRLQEVKPGFEPANLLTMRIALPPTKYENFNQSHAFFQQLFDRLEARPDVESVGAINSLPFGGGGGDRSFSIEDQPTPAGHSRPDEQVRFVSPNYFHTMQIPLLSGRDFTRRDLPDTPPVAIVNSAFARKFWADGNAIGKRISFSTSNPKWYEIVGIVGNVKHRGLDIADSPELYIPAFQPLFVDGNLLPMYVAVRTANSASLATAMRGEVAAIDRDQPVSSLMTMEQRISDSVAPRRFNMFILGLFAALALVLAAIGIYGIMAFSVVQRTHEIGVRMALGASASDVLKLVLSNGFKLALIGIVVGLVAAFAATRVLSSLLYDVSATDPVIFIVDAMLLAVAALLACYIPARRATKVDPLVALRYE